MLDMTFSLKGLKSIIFKTTNTSQHVEFFHSLIFIILLTLMEITYLIQGLSVLTELLGMVEARYPETLAYCIIIHGL